MFLLKRHSVLAIISHSKYCTKNPKSRYITYKLRIYSPNAAAAVGGKHPITQEPLEGARWSAVILLTQHSTVLLSDPRTGKRFNLKGNEILFSMQHSVNVLETWQGFHLKRTNLQNEKDQNRKNLQSHPQRQECSSLHLEACCPPRPVGTGNSPWECHAWRPSALPHAAETEWQEQRSPWKVTWLWRPDSRRGQAAPAQYT